jgi:2-polyprenyl-6-methoxyphenol hydroxylase-like FAD-dependent oxidoreductase
VKVAIVGGGIGGMTLALSLLDAGLGDVEIY